jgi:uridine kinase
VPDGLGARLVVGISGGSETGRAGLADALTAALGTERATRLCHDAYQRGTDGAVDHGVFLQHLGLLRAGLPVRPPIPGSSAGRGVVPPRPIIVVDGARLLEESSVRAAVDLSIHLDGPGFASRHRRSYDGERDRLAAHVAAVQARHAEPTASMADLVLGAAGPPERLAEVAAAVVLDRLARTVHGRPRVAS